MFIPEPESRIWTFPSRIRKAPDPVSETMSFKIFYTNFFPSRIRNPDPGNNKALDPGSGTLPFTTLGSNFLVQRKSKRATEQGVFVFCLFIVYSLITSVRSHTYTVTLSLTHTTCYSFHQLTHTQSHILINICVFLGQLAFAMFSTSRTVSQSFLYFGFGITGWEYERFLP